ncbi:hypothetical protein MTR_3g093700 [Medicago truncatula]|uniref:Uncharacterized protein n=1 Tax=Medicago truncatula TaxID=3880 RepID=A0A072V1E8_MEDTR|nr:hypothetical protein MTR_3g093700 [Medicago truncatula]
MKNCSSGYDGAGNFHERVIVIFQTVSHWFFVLTLWFLEEINPDNPEFDRGLSERLNHNGASLIMSYSYKHEEGSWLLQNHLKSFLPSSLMSSLLDI